MMSWLDASDYFVMDLTARDRMDDLAATRVECTDDARVRREDECPLISTREDEAVLTEAA
jgi:hypothetical protein